MTRRTGSCAVCLLVRR